MMYSKGELFYEGKAKKIFNVNESKDFVWVEYKDSLTAFNAQKTSSFENKGAINREITEIIFDHLKFAGVKHHLVKSMSETEIVCERVKIIPLEVVIRNTLAGSTAKKLGFEEGRKLEKPLVEFYFKDDALGDPFVSDDQALLMKAVISQSELEQLKKMGLKINEALRALFAKINIDLVDFKIELGRQTTGEIILADEITPDTCRLWDLSSGEKMDKDRFRKDLGNIKEAYEEVLTRLRSVKWKNKK